jgi:hypothetical protein
VFVAEVLTSHTWYRAGSNPASVTVARYVFRPDGSGRYEPSPRKDLPPEERAERSKAQEFRYEAKNGELRIRFAKAREWFSTPFSLEPGPRKYSDTARFARHVLRLKRDPYAFVMAGFPEIDTAWESDAGAELPG